MKISCHRALAVRVGRRFLGAAVVLPAILASAPAWADFGSAFAVSGAGASCAFLASPQVAIDPNGNAVFSWEHFDSDRKTFRVEARTRSADGVFGPILILSGRSKIPMFHRLAVDAGANAIVAWALRPESGPDHAQFRALSAAGVLGPVENLSNVLPADFARVAMNAQGQAIFVWRRLNETQETSIIEARTRSAAGVLGPIQRVSFSGQQAFHPEVAINSDGEAVFVWQRIFGTQGLVDVRRRSAAGALAEIRQNLDRGDFPRAAIDRGGDAIIAWTDRRTPQRVQMRTLSATNALGARQLVSQGSGSAFALVQMAMNAAGDAVFAFRQLDQGLVRAKARFRSAAGVFGPDQRLSPGDASGSFVAAAIDARGRSMFGWQRFDGSFTRIQARERRPVGGLRRIQTLSPVPTAGSPHLAMNARGDAAAVWCQTDEEGRVRAFGAVTPPRG